MYFLYFWKSRKKKKIPYWKFGGNPPILEIRLENLSWTLGLENLLLKRRVENSWLENSNLQNLCCKLELKHGAGWLLVSRRFAALQPQKDLPLSS